MSESTNQQETALREIVEDTTNANEPTAIDKTTLPNETSHERETTTTENASSEIENIEPQVATHNSDLQIRVFLQIPILFQTYPRHRTYVLITKTPFKQVKNSNNPMWKNKMEFHNGLEQLKRNGH